MKLIYVLIAGALFYLGLYSVGLDFHSIGEYKAYEKKTGDSFYLRSFIKKCGHYPNEKKLMEDYRDNYILYNEKKPEVISCGKKFSTDVSFQYYSDGFFVKYKIDSSRILIKYYSRWATIDYKYFSTLWTKFEKRKPFGSKRKK